MEICWKHACNDFAICALLHFQKNKIQIVNMWTVGKSIENVKNRNSQRIHFNLWNDDENFNKNLKVNATHFALKNKQKSAVISIE